MKSIQYALIATALLCAPARAQWQTPSHSVPIGQGGGVLGFGNAAPGAAGNVFTSNGVATDPSFKPATINALWLGADPTGTADSAAALQACVTNAAAVKGVCYIPAGNYKLASAGITVTAGVEIYGDHPAGVGGLCSNNTNCATNITSVSGGTNLIPGPGINAITANTNDSVYIHDLEIVYTSLPTPGSGVYGIKISGLGPPFGVNFGSHIWNVNVIQADVGIVMNEAVSFGYDHNTNFNFLTSGLDITGGTVTTTTGTTTNASNSITVASASGVYVGSYVRDANNDITNAAGGGNTVTAISGTTLTLAHAAVGAHSGASMTFSTSIAGGGDWTIGPQNVFLTGPAVQSTCYGMRILTWSASDIIGNKFNAILPSGGTSACTAIWMEPTIDGTVYEPFRLVSNSIEGAWTGIVIYDNCPTVQTCTFGQGTITGNQIWSGAGFQGGFNIDITGRAVYGSFVNDLVVSNNILNVVGGSPNNFNLSFGDGFVSNVLVASNLFGNTGALGATSIFNGSTNTNIKSSGNHTLTGDGQSLGTGGAAPFTLACGTSQTNNLYNGVEAYLSGGTGVTAVIKNGATVYSQASAALPPFSLVLGVRDTLQITCSTPPTATYAALNP